MGVDGRSPHIPVDGVRTKCRYVGGYLHYVPPEADTLVYKGSQSAFSIAFQPTRIFPFLVLTPPEANTWGWCLLKRGRHDNPSVTW